MHSLPELKRLNALHMDERNHRTTGFHPVEPRLHPLVAASIRSIEEQRPLPKIKRSAQFDPTAGAGADMRDAIRMRSYR